MPSFSVNATTHIVHVGEVHLWRTKPADHGVSDQRRPEVQQGLIPIASHPLLRSRHRGLPPLLPVDDDRTG